MEMHSLKTTLPRRVIPLEKVVFHDLGSETILLDLESECYFSLDDVGSRMWRHLHDCEDTETVVSRLLDEYEVEESTLRSDLAALVEKLVEAGLVSEINESQESVL